jgi:hypothetical protein
MYEIFGISYGWDVSGHNGISDLIHEDCFRNLGAQTPYSGGGDSTTYIGVDIGGIDCGNVCNKSLSFDDFTKQIYKERDKLLVTDKFMKNIDKWRKDILVEAKMIMQEGYMTQKVYDDLEALISTEPKLFWTYSTS